jgi:L-amino acid N-acyltransferase YncA
MVAVRNALPSDAEGILEIYAPYVRESFCTFENVVPSVEEMRDRINTCTQKRPWIVCMIDEVVRGYAYASSHRERAAYQWSCECSVYVHEDFQGIGIGFELYTLLFSLLKLQGYRTIYAGITLPNAGSIRLHERCGFTHLATYPNIGYKLNTWKDVGWWKLQINEYGPKPAPPLALYEIDTRFLERQCKKAAQAISQKLVS